MTALTTTTTGLALSAATLERLGRDHIGYLLRQPNPAAEVSARRNGAWVANNLESMAAYAELEQALSATCTRKPECAAPADSGHYCPATPEQVAAAGYPRRKPLAKISASWSIYPSGTRQARVGSRSHGQGLMLIARGRPPVLDYRGRWAVVDDVLGTVATGTVEPGEFGAKATRYASFERESMYRAEQAAAALLEAMQR